LVAIRLIEVLETVDTLRNKGPVTGGQAMDFIVESGTLS
jgi:hypothetical protein